MWESRGKRQEARDKKQETRSKRQETRSKRQEARGKRQEEIFWGKDIDGYWIFIDIATLPFRDRFSELLCRLLFPAFVYFVPFCGSEYCGSIEVFFNLSSKGKVQDNEDIGGYWIFIDIVTL
jgi:hypothetical protein